MPTNRSFNKLIAGLTRMLAKADSENIRDLEDAVDVPSFPDQWNSGNGNDVANRAIKLGPMESASGSGGSKMVSDYSKDTAQPAGSLADAYQRFAEALADQGRRVESVEKSVVAIAGLLSAAIKGESFPQDETKEKGDEEDEKEDTAKALPTMGIPQLMRSLSSASRDTGRTGLRTPPDLAVVKAGNQWDVEIADADARGDFQRVMQLRTMKMRASAVAAGAQMPDNVRNNADLFVQSPGTSRHGF